MRLLRWFLAGSVFLLSACTRDLEGAPCPCADGYECCAALNYCYPRGLSCPADGAGGTQPTETAGSSGASAGADTAPDSGGSRTDGGSAGAFDGSAGAFGGSAGKFGGSAGLHDVGGAPPDAAGAAGEAGAVEPLSEPPFALVATQHNDNARTGTNLNETALNVSTVKQGSFGQLSRRPLRGAVFAQPLVAPDVALPTGGTRDVVYVATMANMVYALDARNPERPPLWSRMLGPSIQLPDPKIANGSSQIWHEVGILGTPVLSLSYGALYVVAATKDGDEYAHTLYKLESSTGDLLSAEPIKDPNFVSAEHAQRGALTFAGGVLYVPFGAYEPGSNASGWIFRFDSNLSPLGGVRLGSPGDSGVTMSGQGPAADNTSSLYFATNPGYVAASNAPVLGSRVLALRGATGSTVQELLSCTSAVNCPSSEFGSSGPLLIPNSNELVLAGQRSLYLFTRGAGGSEDPPSLVQKFRASLACDSGQACSAAPSSPVFWPGSGQAPKPRLFAWAPGDLLRSFEFDPGTQRFVCNAASYDSSCKPLASSPPGDSDDADRHTLASAAHLSVSSHGSDSGSGIVWAAHPYTTDSIRNPDGILRAFDAEDLTLAWSTENAGTRLGPLAPGATPTVSGGRVFMGTADGIGSKVTFWDKDVSATPALTALGDDSLLLAWTVALPEMAAFELTRSTDGFHFGNYRTIADPLFAAEPALATDGTRVYLAWTSNAPPGRPVRVAMSTDWFEHYDFTKSKIASATPGPLAYDAISAPALVYGNHRLFLAFHDENRIFVLSSSDGLSFDTSTIIPVGYSSYETPALAYAGGKLYLMSPEAYGYMHVYVSADDGLHFSAPTLLPVLTRHPALLSFGDESGNQPDLSLLFSDITDYDDRQRIKIASVIDGDFSQLVRTHRFEGELAQIAISAARFRGAWYMTWMGAPDNRHPNVARYSPGELVTYGMKPAP
ncbi:MAG TPA: hypothetical protein VFK05_22320 [Polyangiaceae bacterium]|nr:hypothetical protein [Polyangiaceae bacterium]